MFFFSCSLCDADEVLARALGAGAVEAVDVELVAVSGDRLTAGLASLRQLFVVVSHR